MRKKNEVTLTDRVVMGLPAPTADQRSKTIEYTDARMPHLKLEVSKTGTRTFRFRYVYRGERKATRLGSFPATTCAEARQRALEMLRVLDSGADPQAERDRVRGMPTFAEFARDSYLPYAKVSKSSYKNDESKLRVHLVPRFGDRRLDSLGVREIQLYHAERRQSNCDATANRHLALLSKMLGLAVSWGVLRENPCASVKQVPENNQRDRKLDGDELRRILIAIDEEPNRTIASAIKLLLLTGLRRQEVIGARWEFVDLERGSLYLPKTKNGQSRHVPLNEEAVALLAAQPSRSESPWVFPGRDGTKALVNPVKAFRRIKERAGIEQSFRIHDLRHSFASLVVSSGGTLYHAQHLLGHKSSKTTQRYAHLADSEQRRASETVSQAVRQAAGQTC